MNPDDFEDLISAIRNRRRKGKDDDTIRTELLASAMANYTAEDLVSALEELDRRAQRQWWPAGDPSEGGALISENVREDCWYLGPDPDMSPRWDAVRKGLVAKFGAGSAVEASVDTTSTRVVGLLADPRTRGFHRRGLVLGYVQSGKTTNFTALAAKAADAGYRMVIVLSGMNENLRLQTQLRLDHDLTLNGTPGVAGLWRRLTTGEADFQKTPQATVEEALGNANACAYAVVKKNTTRLRNLYRFLAGNEDLIGRTPILVIDDEADQASIDTSDAQNADKRTRINEWILKILGLGRVTYVGYTATPFANLFVDPRFQEKMGTFDIYPGDFIYSLPEPGDAYFGARRLFGAPADPDADPEDADTGADVIRLVTDTEAGRVRGPGTIPAEAPDALESAIRYFLMATTARRLRDQGDQHSTMLIHTSQRVAVHNALLKPVNNEVADLKAALKTVSGGQIDRLRALWDSERNRYDPEARGGAESFDEILAALPEVLDKVTVVEENSSSVDRLVYSKDGGDVVIVVGGNTLSRGLTLEGLVVSYFVRSSSAYDTLLQMGRWFGYRAGYADLPRVWMTEELEEWFEHLARVEIELRAEISRYEQGDSINPRELGPRIRAHPRMMITARSKMQHAVQMRSDFGERVHQTTHFDLTGATSLRRTIAVTQDFLHGLRDDAGEEHDLGGSVVFRDVPGNGVLDYLEAYPFHPSEGWFGDSLMDYVVDELDRGLQWNVAVMGSTTGEFADSELIGGVAVRLWNRSRYEGPAQDADIGALRNSGRDETIDLTLDLKAPVEKAADRLRQRMEDPRFGHHALLAVYPVAKDSRFKGKQRNERKKRVDLESPENLVGLMLVFPASRNPYAGVFSEIDPELLKEAQSTDDIDVDTAGDAGDSDG